MHSIHVHSHPKHLYTSTNTVLICKVHLLLSLFSNLKYPDVSRTFGSVHYGASRQEEEASAIPESRKWNGLWHLLMEKIEISVVRWRQEVKVRAWMTLTHGVRQTTVAGRWTDKQCPNRDLRWQTHTPPD